MTLTGDLGRGKPSQTRADGGWPVTQRTRPFHPHLPARNAVRTDPSNVSGRSDQAVSDRLSASTLGAGSESRQDQAATAKLCTAWLLSRSHWTKASVTARSSCPLGRGGFVDKSNC